MFSTFMTKFQTSQIGPRCRVVQNNFDIENNYVKVKVSNEYSSEKLNIFMSVIHNKTTRRCAAPRVVGGVR